MALLGKNLRHFGIASVTDEIESRKQSARSVEIRGLEIVLRRNTDSHPSAATRRFKISPRLAVNLMIGEQRDFWCLKNVHGGQCKIMLRQIKQA